MASCQMCARLSRLLTGTVLGSTVRDVTVPLLLMHLHISHLLNSLNSSLPSTSVPRSILPAESEREKTSLLNLFEWHLAKVGERESTEGNPWCSALVADATKIYFTLFFPRLLQICSPCLFLSKWGEAVKSFSCAGRGCLIWQRFNTA